MPVPAHLQNDELKGRAIKLGSEWVMLRDVQNVTPVNGPQGVELRVRRKGGKPDKTYRGRFVDDVHRALKKEGF